jgi:site-specific recombinase XerD
MLKVYRRHNPILCQHTERTWRRCACPLWADGSLAGKRFHKTLKTRNWDDAQKKAQKLEAEGQEGGKRKTILEATDAFIRDAEARGLRPSTLKKYRELFSKLKTFTEGAGVQRIDECSVEFLREFRESWKISPLTATKRLEYLRSFFRFCSDSGWIKDRTKTKTDVRLPLPGAALSALAKVPKTSLYYFWTGTSKSESCASVWQQTLRTLFELAEIENGHAHRFRDTFAVESLSKGVPIESVSVLLGHRRVAITEKHYAPWVESRQQHLDELVRRTF